MARSAELRSSRFGARNRIGWGLLGAAGIVPPRVLGDAPCARWSGPHGRGQDRTTTRILKWMQQPTHTLGERRPAPNAAETGAAFTPTGGRRGPRARRPAARVARPPLRAQLAPIAPPARRSR